MFGDKLNMIMSLDAPSESYMVDILGNGEVIVSFKDKDTKIRGSITFAIDSDMEFIYHVLTRLGFKEEYNGK